MEREEARIRSEGALDAAETALARVEKVLKATDWVAQLRAQTVLPERLDDAIEQIKRLDPALGGQLDQRREVVAQRAKALLRELEIDSTATRIDDLLAQLLARVRVARPKPRRFPKPVVWSVIGIALVGLVTAWRGHPEELAIVAIIVFMLWAASRR